MRIPSHRPFLAISLSAAVIVGTGVALLGVCGPFTDVAPDTFCPFVLEIFYMGITTGTTPTTYDPASAVSRLQMAAFLSRTVDGVIRRSSRRTILNRLWIPTNPSLVAGAAVGTTPQQVQSDGAGAWVAVRGDNLIRRMRDDFTLETWTGAESASGILVMDRAVFATGHTSPGKLYGIDRFLPPGAVSLVASNLGANPFGLAFDGTRIFTANNGPPGSVSIVDLAVFGSVSTVTAGFSSPTGALFEGTNVWVTDVTHLKKLDSAGAILQTVTVGSGAFFPVFDGTNIWVPNSGSNSVSVVRAATGNVLATLTGNGQNVPVSAAFDGERVLVTNAGGVTASLWNAASLAPLGSFDTLGTSPYGASSDGLHFYVTHAGGTTLARF